jgi:hypothetical protein
MQMAQLPESLTELKEYCAHCGKVLTKGGSYVRATIEQLTAEGDALVIDCDKRYFCKECLRGGIYISVKNPETATDAQ